MRQTRQQALHGDGRSSVPAHGGHSLTSAERRTLDLSQSIRGWGSDLDEAVRPGVPRDKAPELGVEALYPPIEKQVARTRIQKSSEHGQMPPVFGDTCPPHGVSGLIRDVAYRLSEGRIAHWLLLLTADRVDMVEGLMKDLVQLRIPNIPKEMGLMAELKYNRKGLVKGLALVGAGVVALRSLSRSLELRRT